MPSGISLCECHAAARSVQHSSCLFLQPAPDPLYLLSTSKAAMLSTEFTMPEVMPVYSRSSKAAAAAQCMATCTHLSTPHSPC
jgi:hypothetical protein